METMQTVKHLEAVIIDEKELMAMYRTNPEKASRLRYFNILVRTAQDTFKDIP